MNSQTFDWHGLRPYALTFPLMIATTLGFVNLTAWLCGFERQQTGEHLFDTCVSGLNVPGFVFVALLEGNDSKGEPIRPWTGDVTLMVGGTFGWMLIGAIFGLVIDERFRESQPRRLSP